MLASKKHSFPYKQKTFDRSKASRSWYRLRITLARSCFSIVLPRMLGYHRSRPNTIPYTTTKTTSLHESITHQAHCHKPGTQIRQRLSQPELPPTTSTSIPLRSGLFYLRAVNTLPMPVLAARLAVHFAVPGYICGIAVCRIGRLPCSFDGSGRGI